MKRNIVQKRGKQLGFTLIEMIGVLAIIALLAGMLIPRIVEAIKEARVNSTVVTLNTLKAAVAQYYARHGTLANLTTDDDEIIQTLISEGYLEKAPEVRVGSGLSLANVDGETAKGGSPGRYDLDGDENVDTGTAAAIIEAVISEVSLEDAYKLSLAIDGEDMSTEPTGEAGTDLDRAGRVEYDFSGSLSGTVYVYLGHE